MFTWPPSALLLVAFGIALLGIGFFFVVLRPALLPEDMRFIGLTLAQLQSEQPRMAQWLLHVFRVLGGWATAAGILTIAIAATAYRRHDTAAGVGVLVAGAVSIGWMVVVNFMIDSDFKWTLLAIASLWAGSVVLFALERVQLKPVGSGAAASRGSSH
jgi:hypothetical protein